MTRFLSTIKARARTFAIWLLDSLKQDAAAIEQMDTRPIKTAAGKIIPIESSLHPSFKANKTFGELVNTRPEVEGYATPIINERGELTGYRIRAK